MIADNLSKRSNKVFVIMRATSACSNVSFHHLGLTPRLLKTWIALVTTSRLRLCQEIRVPIYAKWMAQHSCWPMQNIPKSPPNYGTRVVSKPADLRHAGLPVQTRVWSAEALEHSPITSRLVSQCKYRVSRCDHMDAIYGRLVLIRTTGLQFVYLRATLEHLRSWELSHGESVRVACDMSVLRGIKRQPESHPESY